MKRFIGATLLLILFPSILGCSPVHNDIVTTSTQSTVNYSLEDVLIAHAVDMGELTGLKTNSDFLSIISSNDSVIALAQNFSITATKLPIQAQISTVENMEHNDMIYQINELTPGETAMACSNLLLHTTQIHLPSVLSENTLVCLKYNEECFIFVLYIPIDGHITSVYTYSVFKDVATNLLKTLPVIVSKDTKGIEASCTLTVDVEFCCDENGDEVSVQYLQTLVETAISSVSINKIKSTNIPNHIMPYVDHLLHIFTEQPSNISLYYFTDDAKQLLGGEYQFDLIDNSSLREIAYTEFIVSTPHRIAETFGPELLAANSIFQSATQPINLGSISIHQTAPVLAVVNYSDDATCIVCIYGNNYGLLQFTFACLPEMPWIDHNYETVGLELIE